MCSFPEYFIYLPSPPPCSPWVATDWPIYIDWTHMLTTYLSQMITRLIRKVMQNIVKKKSWTPCCYVHTCRLIWLYDYKYPRTTKTSWCSTLSTRNSTTGTCSKYSSKYICMYLIWPLKGIKLYKDLFIQNKPIRWWFCINVQTFPLTCLAGLF